MEQREAERRREGGCRIGCEKKRVGGWGQKQVHKLNVQQILAKHLLNARITFSV